MSTIIEGIKFYSVLDAAAALHLSTITVRKYIKTGKLKARKVGNAYLITERDIFAMLEVEPPVAENAGGGAQLQ